MNAPYKYGKKPGELERKRQRRKRRIIFFCLILLALGGVAAWNIIRDMLQPESSLKQAAAVTRTVKYADEQTKRFETDSFSLELPVTFQESPRPAGSYNVYNWQRSDSGSDGELLAVYKDTIPVNYAVNRVLIVSGGTGQLVISGPVSDNCSTFTKGTTIVNNDFGVPAKWLDVSFLCDQFNKERDVIGTSSTESINTVTLTSPTTGQHKFFFTYTNQGVHPNYTVFEKALQSFRLK
jgi:hypothetical protein